MLRIWSVCRVCLLVFTFVAVTTHGFAKEAGYTLAPAETEVELKGNTRILKELSQGVGAIAEVSRKALVFVSVSKTVRGWDQSDPFGLFGFGLRRMPNPRQEGLGSGFFIDVGKGYVLTNNHVIDGADEINLKLANGKSFDAKVIGSEPDMDIAVVQIKEQSFDRSGLSSLVLGDSDQLSVGSFVVALGAPFGLEASISFGVVSALGRGSLSITEVGDFIQTDAAINPGNSGGPLVDMNGRVVGMNTAIFSKSGGYNGIGFTVPSNLVRRVATDLIRGVKVTKGYLGVYYQELSSDFLKLLRLPADTTGIIVTQVEPGAPADKAGIKPKDVIVTVDGKKLEGERDLVNRISLMKPGHTAKLGVIREGKQFTASVEIGHRPGSGLLDKSREEPSDDAGLGLELSLQKGGLLVEKIEPRSPAVNRLHPGDVILSIEEYNFDNEKDLKQALKNFNRAIAVARKNKQSSVLLRIRRGGGFGFITIVLS
ncbi:MAG: trypsin-like peptidase domain-containing protein [Deltaproteobacteria bacterium]|nr:trypsin-like peptidase domain-containing protein [Deltaproteobacteria bacterium]